MNRSLFLAILAMDSYNRGYGVGVEGLDEEGQIGNATIIPTPSQTGWQAAGFYAIAYDMTGVAGFAAGERVISYRGTDGSKVTDIVNGWATGVGVFNTPQANMAIEFYKTLVGTDIDGAFIHDPFAANITLTGHSLGGGLGGYVSTLYTRPAILFDNMPFELSSSSAYAAASTIDPQLGISLVQEFIYANYNLPALNPGNISGWSTANEILSDFRNGQATPVTPLESNGSSALHTVAGRANKLHMMELLVNLMWADQNGQTDWQFAGPQLWDAYFDPTVAASLTNIGDVAGSAGPDGALGRMIAYSAIDEGERPFGDTGIIAMFDDAGDLGRALSKGVNSGTGTSQALKDSAGVLAKALVQYAGKLALGKVLGGAGSPYANGVLNLSTDGLTLTADFSSGRWDDGAAHTSIIGRDGLINTALATANSSTGSGSDLATGIAWQYPVSGVDAIASVVFATTSDATPRTLPTSGGGFGTTSSIFVAGNGNDTITGSSENEVIVGGEGNDAIDGGAGKDILLGGVGNDILTGGEGNDFIAGGAGDDTLNLGLGPIDAASISFKGIKPTSGQQRTSIELVNGADTDRIVDIEKIQLTNKSDHIALLGDVDDMDGGGPTVAMGLSQGPAAFGQDVVDASASTTGIYFDMGTGAIVGLDTSTTRGGTFGILGWIPSRIGAAFEPTDIRITGANSVTGTIYSDALFASAGKLGSGEGYSDLHGGAGNDLLVGAGWESHLFGGEGADQFAVGANTIIEDGESKDGVSYGGLTIFGGTKQWWMEGGTAYWSPFSTILGAFPVIGASVLVSAAVFVDVATMKFANFERDQNGDLRLKLGWGHGGTALIKDYELDLDTGVSTAGVTVFQQEYTTFFKDYSFGKFTQYVNLALKAGFGVGLHGFDPLVLDLDGDGYELTTEGNSKAYFEFDTDGFAERTGWVRGDDALLARDANGNGNIDGVTELFGNRTTSGFTMLAVHDGNADGVINASDAVYAELRVWQDANQNGISDAGELKTLAQAGIVSINLASTAPGTATAVAGNQIVRTSTFTRTDGTTSGVADVAFDISETATKWLGDSTVSASAALLPQLRGFGEVKDLRVAMTGDAALQGMVDSFVANPSNDLAVLKSGAEAILYAWAGVGGVAATALGTGGFDTRKLAFLEKYSGHQLMPRDGNGAIQLTNIAEMQELWSDQLNRLTLRLVVQGPMAAEFAGVSYRADLDLLVADSATGLGDLYGRLLADLPSSPAAALAQWQAWAPLLGVMADGMVRFDNNIVRDDFIAAQLLAAMDGVLQPLDFAALAGAMGLDNLRLGTGAGEALARAGASGTAIYLSGGGSDTITGGSGQDVYVFGRTIGNVVINDEEAKPAGDRIRFSFLTEADVTLSRSANDLLIMVNATGESIRVTGQFAPVVALSSDVLLSTNKGVEEIQFADGKIFEIPEIMSAVGTGTSGNDTMTGTMHSDVFLGGLGDDTMLGGDDADLYVIEAGDGHDVIRDTQTTVLLRAADMVIFGDDLAPQDLALSRTGASGNDLLISIGSNGQSVLIENQFAYSVLGYNDKLAPNSRIEAFGFRDYGESWSNKDIQQMLIAQASTTGNDTILGFGDDDIIDASKGNDTLIGLDGQDTYMWGAGDGNDLIDESSYYIDVKVGLLGLSLTAKADTVSFKGLNPDDLVFTRPTAADDLVITNSATGETLTVHNQFAGFQTGVLGAQWFDRIEWFGFADGTRISWQQVLQIVTTGGEGNDSLWGDLYQDTLIGGLGDDYLSGGGYADTYIFNAGDGHDTVDDKNTFIIGSGFLSVDTTPDILRLGSGITAAGIGFDFNNNDMTLVIGANGDSVTLKGQNDYYNTGVFGAISNGRIERIEFADEGVWTWQDINALAIDSKTTAGDDVIVGFDMADRFAASAGNDIMRGGNSGDVYEFGIGSGQDRIEESIDDVFFGDNDAVEFGPGLTASSIVFVRSGDDLIVRIAGTTDELTIAGEFDNYIGYTNRDIERFVFADGTVVTKEQVMTSLTVGTAGNDIIEGFHTNDTLIGGAGDDALSGLDGSDRYLFNRGDGRDTISESVEFVNLADNDRIVFGAGIAPSDIILSRTANALTLSISGTTDSVTITAQYAFASGFTWHDIENVEFADGTVWSKRDMANMLMGGTPGNDTILGTFENDDINGLAGNDLLQGGDGADTYYFSLGDGQDTIQESVSNVIISDDDQIVFGEGIAREDMTFVRNGDNLTIGIAGTSDVISILGQFDNYVGSTSRDIEQIQFADESVMTAAEIRAVLTTGTIGNDVILGFHTNDVLDGGAGDDQLNGLDGSDTYLFGRGSGHDTISESVEFVNLADNDRVLFGANVSQSDVTFVRDGNDLVITIVGTGDTLRIAGEFSWSGGFTWHDVERFDFADGSSLSKQYVQDLLLTPTAGNDTITGFGSADVIRGAGGDDALLGKDGSDGYYWARGDGSDTLTEGVDQGFDTLYLENISPSDVTLTRDSNTLYVNVAASGPTVGDGGTLTLLSSVNQNFNQGIDRIQFSDGTIWNRDNFQAILAGTAGTDGDDNITGSSGADVLAGGKGNDTFAGQGGNDTLVGGVDNDIVSGDTGNDTYVFNLGDGQDIIRENTINVLDGGNDTLRFGEGILPSGISVAQIDGGNDLLISINGTTDTILLDHDVNNQDYRIEQVEFFDGTVLTHAQLLTLATAPTSGDDTFFGGYDSNTLYGGAGNDTLDARGGNDTLNGGVGNDLLTGNIGNDTYVFNLGDGQDTIRENTVNVLDGGNDTLQFGAGITADGITVTQTTDGISLLIAVNGTTDSVFLHSDINNSDYRTEQVRFDDGTFLTHAQLMTLATAPTSGNDAFYGSYDGETLQGGAGNDTLDARDGDDTLVGGTGNDTLTGNTGNDTYVFNLGDGQDTIRENTVNILDGGNDTLHFGEGIASTGIKVTQTLGGGGLLIAINGTSDSVLIDNTVNNTDYRVEQVQFADGTILTHAQLLALAHTPTAGDDLIYLGTGNDVIAGGGGNDTIDGGGGDDSFQFNGTGNGFDAITGGAGIDSIQALANNTVIGLSAMATIEAISAGGYSGVIVSGSGAADTLNFSGVTLTGIDRIEGGAGNDTITGPAAAATIVGGTGDDTLTGGAGNDTFQFSGTSEGFDAITGGAGTDTISAIANNTVIGLRSLATVEAISAGSFTGVTISGTSVADSLNFASVALTGISRIEGGAGADTITGPATAATIAGGGDDDTIIGGAGNDTFLFSGSSEGFDAITGGAGTDTIQALTNNTVIGLRSLATVEAISAGGFTGVTISGSAAADALNFTGVTLTGIGRIEGGIGNDTITGPATAATFAGGAGDDTIVGGAGNDTFQFSGTGEGFDAITGGTGTDTIQAMANDTVIGIRSLTTIEAIAAGAFTGVTISGSVNADTLNFTGVTLTGIARVDGGAGNDTITGPAAAMVVAGGIGDDTITGGAGNDTFQFNGTGDGFDAITGGVGTDTIIATANDTVIGLRSLNTIEAINAGAFTGVTVSGSAAADTLNFTGVALTGISRIDGGAGNDTITGPAAAATIVGGAGDDTLTGGGGNDAFQFTGTGEGFDAITGGAGTDTIQATSSNTVIGLRSLATVEAITAGSFTGVTISGSSAANTLNFTGVTLTGIERVDGGGGNDIITGSAGNDTLVGGAGSDTLNGGAGIDTVDYGYLTTGFTLSLAVTAAQTVATSDSDTLSNIENVTGGAGNDVLTGTTGDNVLNGGIGDDRLTGGLSNDTLLGGTGADSAVFAGDIATYSISTLNGVVRVVDNSPTVDGNDGTDIIAGIEQLIFKNNVTVGVTSPIILDLDGNGIKTVSSAESEARFDLDGDGLADDTSWIGNTEGFLFLDRDGNGTVTNSGELSFIDDVPGATSDLAGLKAFDSNNDNKLSSSDEKFASFRVWRDNDGDGAVDTGEVLTLAQAGVASIGLIGTPVNASTAFGEVAVLNTGSYTRTNGATMQFADAALTYFSAATNVPELTEQQYDLELKAKKYAITISGGAMVLQPKKTSAALDAGAGRVGANATLNFRDKSIGMLGAIVLDLDGNGVDLKKYNKNKAVFDMNGDGATDDTGWISKRDGLLVIDRDGDGLIADAAELNFAAEDEKAMSALEGLARLDSNGDGKIDSKDARFGELRVWVDANQNGNSDAGELRNLAEAGIASFRLSATAALDHAIKIGDNAVLSTATFTRTSGAVGTLGNVSLGYIPGRAPLGSTTVGRGAAFDPRLVDAIWGGQAGVPIAGDPVKFGAALTDITEPLTVSINPPVDTNMLLNEPARIADTGDWGTATEIGGLPEAKVPTIQPTVMVPMAETIEPAIAAAIAALQTGSTANPLAVFEIPGDTVTFNQIARNGLPWQVERNSLPLTVDINDNWPVEGEAAVAKDGPTLADISAVLEGGTAPFDGSSLDSAKRLALMRQDIAAFGGRSELASADWNSVRDRDLVQMF